MKANRAKQTLILLVAVLALGLAASAGAEKNRYHMVSIDIPGKPADPRHLFYYYPDARTYYNPASMAYTWQEEGHWVAAATQLPSDILMLSNRRVIIDTNVGDPVTLDDRALLIPASEFYYRDGGALAPRYYRPYGSAEPLRYYREYPRGRKAQPASVAGPSRPVRVKPLATYREYPFYYRFYPKYGRDYRIYRFTPFPPEQSYR